ncbi:hypothetical protein L208DRAFT_1416563 [Tricholoma matsutake]|nr:hypothetical protein L208DRAFT_1416563 [Tricholoma matsutake 945]
MSAGPGRTRCQFRLRPQILIFNFLPAAACQIGHYHGRTAEPSKNSKRQLALIDLITHALLSRLVASPPFLYSINLMLLIFIFLGFYYIG